MFKQTLYFAFARYFQFWARLVLRRWKPLVIAVVGTAGKTSTLYLAASVLKAKTSVKVSHKTNAVTSIPLDILGLKQKTFSPFEWLKLGLLAPLKSLKTPSETVYLCEMDSDRLGEMETHTRLIKPDITCFTSAYPCHTENFPGQNSKEVTEKMMYDLGFSLERTKRLSLINGDAPLLATILPRSTQPVGAVSLHQNPEAALVLTKHSFSLSGTEVTFTLNKERVNSLKHTLSPDSASVVQDYPETLTLSFPLALLSPVSMYGVGIAVLLGMLLDVPWEDINQAIRTWRLPPGRMSLFAGKKATTLIDSSYNASRVATVDAIEVLQKLGQGKTIAVLGDMRELGKASPDEHKKVAKALIDNKIRRIILIGKEMHSHVWSILLENGYKENRTVFKAPKPQWAADLLTSSDFLRSGETVLVKGSQNTLFLEGVVEQLLASKNDIAHLCRRETLWQKMREQIYRKGAPS